jgi:hypothetical protein
MADYTITRYLKLKIADDLSADAKYNLTRIDALGATFINDVTETLNIRSAADIQLEAEALAVGGSGRGGSITLGTPANYSNIIAYSTAFSLRSALSLPTGASSYLALAAAQSGLNGSLTLGISGASKSLTVTESGDAVVKDAVQTLTNKSLDGSNNTFTNIPNSATTATSSNVASAIVARDSTGNFAAGTITASLNGNAITATTASNLAGSNLGGDVTNSGNAITVQQVNGVSKTVIASGATAAYNASDLSLPDTIVKRDGSGSFSAANIGANLVSATTVSATSLFGSLSGSSVVGNISGNAANVTGTVAIANGGTGAISADLAIKNLLPTYVNSGTLKVKSDGSGLEWVVGAGQGTVTGVTASAPLSITGDANLTPNVTISQATSSVNGYLSSSDWTTFNSKQAAITGAATTITSSDLTASRAVVSDASGKVAVSSVTSTEVSYLSGVTSGIQSQLGSKEPTITAGTTSQYWRGDKSWQTLNTAAVPESGSLYFTDARAKTAAVVNSTAGNQTDQAPSVSAMKAYVTAQGGGVVSYTWATADGATKSITHNLGTATVSVNIYDENGEDIFVDVVDRTSNNALSLTSSVAPTGNWTVVVRP